MQKAKQNYFRPEERSNYEASLKTCRDLKNVVDTSFDEGNAAGFDEGKAAGFDEGRNAGQAYRNVEIAIRMKQTGEPVSKIMLYTGLSAEQIDKL